ncbi:amidohydrolase family protein [Streptomyces caniferus]|uniref:metal-dependent hydrolase family protein n=1 Tax=Streptomyces caniferus TaxID=285557 RepID=UPI002E27EEC3|nr:amidohydrolase family protein [Streptomyces caniferus]
MPVQSTPRTWLLTNATVLDPESGDLTPDRRILVVDGTIAEVGGKETTHREAPVVDLRGSVVLPGLIDAHVHVAAAEGDLAALPGLSPSYAALHAARALETMLYRGFTTVRDCGGADFGIAQAQHAGLLTGSQLRFGGKALSQTGGHGDVRHRGDDSPDPGYCCPGFGRVCDGVSQCRAAARDELRKGADHLKIVISGGVTSPTDRIDSTQFSIEEITAVVEEATAANRYVAAHAYTPRAIERGLRCGVRSIEHGNFLDDATARLFNETGSYLVPTLVTYSALADVERAKSGPGNRNGKVFEVLDAALQGLETAYRNGVQIAFGTDLLGAMQRHQLTEFRLRAEVVKPLDIIRSATSVAARLLRAEDTLGRVAPGARADLLAVDGNPVEDIGILTAPEQHHRLLMLCGALVKRPSWT